MGCLNFTKGIHKFENCVLLRTVGTHLSTSPSDQGLPQDTTHHSELSTPQETQQFYKIVPQDLQHCHPAQDQNASSKDFHQFHNAARKDNQQFDTVQESQELQHFQVGGDHQTQDGPHLYYGVQGSQPVDQPPHKTPDLGNTMYSHGVQGGQDPQQFRMQLEEMIAARQEIDHSADFRKEVIIMHHDYFASYLLIIFYFHLRQKNLLQVEQRVEQGSEQAAVS